MAIGDASLPGFLQRFGWQSLLLIGLLLHLAGAATAPLFDRDEPRFSQATQEMMDRGEWVVPYFNEEYRFDKPPLTYWWMRVHYWVLGKTEFAARLHSVFSTVIIGVGLYFFARRRFGETAAWWAGLAWMTCFQVFIHGRIAVADMPMVGAIFFASWALWVLLAEEPDRPRRWFWTLYVALGIGFLAKGPIVLAVPALTLLLYRFLFWRKPVPWGRLRMWPGLMISLAMVALWGIPALIETRGLFWQVGMGKHVIDRGLEAFGDRKTFLLYYEVTALISLFPWIANLGVFFSREKREWSQKHAFLVAWAVSPYLIFLFYSTQLMHYVLPAFPAVLLLMMSAATRPGKSSRIESGFFYGYIGLTLAVGLGVMVWVATQKAEWGNLSIGMLWLAGVLVAMSFLALAGRRRWWGALFVAIAFVALANYQTGSRLRAMNPSIQVAQALEALPAGTPLVGFGYQEPSLVFYTGKRWIFPSDWAELKSMEPGIDPRDAALLFRQADRAIERVLVEGPLAVDDAPVAGAPADLATTHDLVRVEGLNYGRSRWESLQLWVPKNRLSE